MNGQKVVKKAGHCYDGIGIPCDFWVKSEDFEPMRNSLNTTKVEKHYCKLFGMTEKYLSECLHCCNKVYGEDYEGEA